MKVALVYDRVNKIGGAERVLAELHKLWPEAPLYTAVYNPKKALWAESFEVKTTFLQHFPFAKNHHEWFAWLTPFAFNTLSFDGYDVVISVTSAEAKGLITKPETLHICYCLTPTRYLWSAKDTYKKNTGFGVFHALVKRAFSLWLPTLQGWDHIASQRPDQYIAISKHVQRRIEDYYQREVDAVIYPPVDTDFFKPAKNEKEVSDYYLLVSRLVPYKRADIVIRACSNLKKRLVVIGDGNGKQELQRMAGPTVEFVAGNLTDQALLGYYQKCRAFLFAGQEDFGIAAAEAQSCGKPVIAYKRSGISEIIREGITGLTFQKQSVDSLEEAIRQFENRTFSGEVCRKNALRFNKQTFLEKINAFVSQTYQRHLITL
jgi:glycosyltransferase involved in cell wall biosynthesis